MHSPWLAVSGSIMIRYGALIPKAWPVTRGSVVVSDYQSQKGESISVVFCSVFEKCISCQWREESPLKIRKRHSLDPQAVITAIGAPAL